jgi:arabinogalactan oligomer/maltooligosaccharide transport system substrate-binding protein
MGRDAPRSEEINEPMKSRYRIASLVAGLAIVVGACSSGGTTPSPSTSSAPGDSQPPASQPIESTAPSAAPLEGTLTVWHTYASGAGTEKTTYDEIIADIVAKNPGLEVNTTVQNFFGAGNIFEKYALEAQTGGGPDMFIVPNDSLGAQVRQNLLAELDTLAGDQMNQFAPLSVEGCTVDGKLYCIPESLKAVGMYYDKSKVATPPTTTEEFVSMQESGAIEAGFNQGAYHGFGFWAAYGGQLMDDTGKCVADTTGVGDAHKFFADTKAAGSEWSGANNYAKVADAFKQGQINVLVDGPWASGGYLETLGENLAVAPLPAGPSGPSQPMTGTDGWFINPNSTNQELAVAVALLISTEYEQQFVDKAGHIPAFTGATITDPITQGFAAAVENGFPRPQAKELDNFWGNFDNALNETLDKGTDPTAAVTAACAAMNTANGK